MKVYIANFGRENLLWPICCERNVVLTYEDEDAWAVRQKGDRTAFIEYCVASKVAARGVKPTRALASRWFNLVEIVTSSSGDLWVHREKEQLWWTTTLGGPAVTTNERATWSSPSTANVYITAKPAEPWRNVNGLGSKLTWSGIHPKARQFLYTEATLQELSRDHSSYAHALVDGSSLTGWHERVDWNVRAMESGHGAVISLGAKDRTVARMVAGAMETVRASGPPSLKIPKRKSMTFGNEHEFVDYVDSLVEAQEGLCALTDLPLQFDGEQSDSALLYSLDRIDSDGPYGPGNLQLVCRFVNGWKSDQPDDEFRRLMNMVRRLGD